MNEELLSKISEFIIYYIMYSLACGVGILFINYTIQKQMILNFRIFKIHVSIILDLIFISLIGILFFENYKFRDDVAKFLFEIFSFKHELSKEVENGFKYLFNIIMLLPLLATASSYTEPIIGGWGIFVIVIIFMIIFYCTFRFLRSWDEEIRLMIDNFSKKIKQKSQKQKCKK